VRILYVSHSHPPDGAILDNVGGMQRVSQQLIRKLEQKESVTLFKETIHAAGNGKIAAKTGWFLFKELMELPNRVRDNNVDVVLFSSMVTASLAYLLRSRISVPLVTITHGRDVTLPVSAYQWFIPRVFKRLDGVISVSEATLEECVRRGLPPGKGVALPNGFDLNRLDHFPDKQESRNRLQENFHIPLDKKFMLLTVGRNVKRKGHEWFIREVMSMLGDGVVYVTVGDGPEHDSIREASDNMPYGDRIFLLGRQPDEVLKQVYAAADVFVMPNVPVEGDMEGFGIVLLEANMARTPAVAADLEGIKDVIAQGENGYRVPTLDAAQFAETVRVMMNNKKLTDFSDQARSYVQEKFDWNHVAEQYLNYLQTVINRRYKVT